MKNILDNRMGIDKEKRKKIEELQKLMDKVMRDRSRSLKINKPKFLRNMWPYLLIADQDFGG